MADEFEVSSTDDENCINSNSSLLKFLKVKRLIDDCIKENGKKYIKVQWQDTWVEFDEVQKFCPKELQHYVTLGKPQNELSTHTGNGHVIVKMEELNNHFRDSIDFQTNSTQKLVAYSQLQKAGFLVEGGNVNHHTEEKVAQGTVQEGNGRSLNSMANVRNQLYWQQVAGIDVLKLSHYNNINSMAESSKRQNTQRRRQPHQLYKCEVCGSEFVHRTHLKIHQRTHTGEKPYKCEFCGKCFAQKGNLHVHMKTHTGIKEFVCDFCHRAFVTNAQLVVHVRTHINPNNRKKNNVSSTFNKNNLPTNSNKQPESENDQLNTSFNPVMTQYEVSTNSKYISSKSGSMQVDTVGGKLKSQPSELTNLEGLVLNPAEIDQHRGHKVSSVGNLQNLQQQQHTIVKSQLGINDNIQNNLVLTQDNSLYDLQTSVRPPL